jgi:CTP synthase (UTP-ammonia lyase)
LTLPPDAIIAALATDPAARDRPAPDLSLAFRLYGEEIIHERHRHRYEFNSAYEKTIADHGMRVVGKSLDGKFVEIVELPGHPWYLAVQFHPEFKSRPLRPHPLFAGFIEAAYRRKQSDLGLPTANVTAIGDRRARG